MAKCEWNDGKDLGRYWEENPCSNQAKYRTKGFKPNFNLCEEHARVYEPLLDLIDDPDSQDQYFYVEKIV